MQASDKNPPMPHLPQRSSVAPVPKISSHYLLGDLTEIRIDHRGDVYRLRCTRNGKLILYK